MKNLPLRILLFTILYPGTVTLLVPWLILRHSSWIVPGFAAIPGAALLLTGIAIYLWCAREFAIKGHGTPAPYDPPRTVVRTGLYRYSRNPMYLGIVAILLGETLIAFSLGLAIYTVAVFLTFHLRVLLYEEPVLRRQFGSDYDDYSRKVPRWFPWRLPE